MTLPKTRRKKSKDEPTLKQEDIVKGWGLLNPSDYIETKELDVFKHFLNSKGTIHIELANLLVDKFTLVARGAEEGDETACVLFHANLTDISRPNKIELVENIYALPKVGSIEKNRLGNTLASYFSVEKETSRD